MPQLRALLGSVTSRMTTKRSLPVTTEHLPHSSSSALPSETEGDSEQQWAEAHFTDLAAAVEFLDTLENETLAMGFLILGEQSFVVRWKSAT